MEIQAKKAELEAKKAQEEMDAAEEMRKKAADTVDKTFEGKSTEEVQ